MNDSGSLSKIAESGVRWSIVQNWSGKLFTFALSILLARILSREEYGIASAAWLILLLIPLVADLGFSEALMQRRNLKSVDVNAPFFAASGFAVLLFLLLLLNHERVAQWAELEGHSAYVIAMASVIVITAPSMFQEAMYKRNLKFRELALRSFAANLGGGAAALLCALAGFGIWTFLVQAYVTTLINATWIWSRPVWVPDKQIDLTALRDMWRFSSPVLAQRLTDFAGSRLIDFLIVGRLGLVAYGLYVLGSRLQQTLMQLLQGAFSDVSLTVLSTIADDLPRLAAAYRKTISVFAAGLSPVFVLIAAVSPEICAFLFGSKWSGVEEVACPLLLLGAVNCVQYMNGPFMAARGKPQLILVTGLVKAGAQIAALMGLGASSVGSLTWTFVTASLVATPVSFFLAWRVLELRQRFVLSSLLLPATLCAGSFGAVHLVRASIAPWGLPHFWQGAFLGGIFVSCYVCLLAAFDRPKLDAGVSFGKKLAQRFNRR